MPEAERRPNTLALPLTAIWVLLSGAACGFAPSRPGLDLEGASVEHPLDAGDTTPPDAAPLPLYECAAPDASAPTPAPVGEPIVLASGQSWPSEIAVDATSVYWTDQQAGAVRKVPIRGGDVTTLVSGMTTAVPDAIAVDGTNVYFTAMGSFYGSNTVSYTDGIVVKIPTGGGTPTTIASGQTDPEHIAVDATSVYWTTGAYRTWTQDESLVFTGAIMKAPIDGGPAVTLATGQAQPSGIVVNATSVFWTTLGGFAEEGYGTGYPTDGVLGTVMTTSLDGGPPIAIASGQIYPNSIAVDATNVYWASGSYWLTGTGSGFTVGSVEGAPIGGGPAFTLASGGGDEVPFGVAVDGTNVYWATWGCDGITVRVAPAGGGPASILLSGQSPYDIAVDATSVYWTDLGHGMVMKIAKSPQPVGVVGSDRQKIQAAAGRRGGSVLP